MVTIVTPESYDSPCAEVWVDPDLLDTDDDELAEQAAIDATWALWMLTGERFHGAQCWVEDYRPIHGYCNIKLRRFPVTEVVAVSRVDVCDTTIDPGCARTGQAFGRGVCPSLIGPDVFPS
jgi:hypothetical protein